MLNALKISLKRLKNESGGDPEHHKPLSWKNDTGEDSEAGLRNMILMMPEMIAQIRSWLDEPAMPIQHKHLHVFLLFYLYHPTDLLPEESVGFWGYLDDAYLTGKVYILTMSQMNHDEQRFLPNQDCVRDQLPNWLRQARQCVPAITRRLDEMVDDVMANNGDPLFEDVIMGVVSTAGRR